MKLLSLFITTVFLLLNVSLSEAADIVKVASIFSKTGKAALNNAQARIATRRAIKELNQQGGVLGKQLKLIEFDNKSTALGSKVAAIKAVQAHVVTVFGSLWSSHSIAIAPILQKAKIPMISPTSTNPKLTLVGDYIFRVCFIDSFQGRVMANFAFKELKVETAAVLINADSKYSEGLAEYFINRFEIQGGKIILKENYLDQTTDFAFLINKIKTHQPSVIFLPGHIKDSAYIIKQARDSGIPAIFLGGDGFGNIMYDLAGKTIERNYYSQHWHKNMILETNKKFVRKYKKYLKKLDASSALSNDSVFLFADAVRRAGSFEPTQIRDAIAATENFKGVTGNISFNKNGDPIKSAVILKFEKGTSIYVKTIEP